MNYKDTAPGKNPPHDVNVIIEIAKGEGMVKYEFDKETGNIEVDRIRESAMPYPINYGCVPNSLSDDGDPLDVIIYCEHSFQTGTIVAVRPVGVLLMDDEKGHDVKVLAVPADRLSSAYLDIQDIDDVPLREREKLEHFFKHYKDLEGKRGKMSVTAGWKDAAVAQDYVMKAIEGAKKPASPQAPQKPPAP
jgi:inorganic pyrophosphatase